jgi:hypothetical protein
MYNWQPTQEQAILIGAENLIKLEALQQLLNSGNPEIQDLANAHGFTLNNFPSLAEIESALEDLHDEIHDQRQELEGCTIGTNIRCDFSRDYESRSVAFQCLGHWVGWTEWSGGGKHGEPESIDKDPYLLRVTKEVLVKQYEFSIFCGDESEERRLRSR